MCIRDSVYMAESAHLADPHVLVGLVAADGGPVTWPLLTSLQLAKAIAGTGARTARHHCQQVLAGIGFTTEHPLHRYVRRTLVLDGLLGDARSLTRRLGDDLLRTRRLPAILPL